MNAGKYKHSFIKSLQKHVCLDSLMLNTTLLCIQHTQKCHLSCCNNKHISRRNTYLLM